MQLFDREDDVARKELGAVDAEEPASDGAAEDARTALQRPGRRGSHRLRQQVGERVQRVREVLVPVALARHEQSALRERAELAIARVDELARVLHGGPRHADGARTLGAVFPGARAQPARAMVDISNAGGLTLVQSPEDAFHSGMPRSVMERIDVDYVLPAAALGTKLAELAGAEVTARVSPPGESKDAPSSFSCPECHGVLWRNGDGTVERYRCRVGHVYAPKTLFAAQSHALEEAIWAAYRALEESADLARRLAARARTQSLPLIAERYERKHTDAMQRAALVRAVIDRGELDAVDPTEVAGLRPEPPRGA